LQTSFTDNDDLDPDAKGLSDSEILVLAFNKLVDRVASLEERVKRLERTEAWAETGNTRTW
jgi:3-phenylpropionate/cinnamic acid dioxygenase small subunit